MQTVRDKGKGDVTLVVHEACLMGCNRLEFRNARVIQGQKF